MSDQPTAAEIEIRNHFLKFKGISHGILDRMGVPEFKDAPCRIKARLEWVEQQLQDQARRALGLDLANHGESLLDKIRKAYDLARPIPSTEAIERSKDTVMNDKLGCAAAPAPTLQRTATRFTRNNDVIERISGRLARIESYLEHMIGGEDSGRKAEEGPHPVPDLLYATAAHQEELVNRAEVQTIRVLKLLGIDGDGDDLSIAQSGGHDMTGGLTAGRTL